MFALLIALQSAGAPPSAPPPTINAKAILTIQDAVVDLDRRDARRRGRGKSRRARPVEPLVSLFSEGDYPPAALKAEKQGLVGVRLTIGRSGRIGRCAIVRTSRSPTLDAATCRILVGRARYRPALDRTGRPVPDRDYTHVRWKLEEEEDETPAIPPEAPVPLAASTVTVTYEVLGPTLGHCRVTSDDAPPVLVRDACAALENVAGTALAAVSLRPPPQGSRVEVTTRLLDPVEPAANSSALLTIDATGLVTDCKQGSAPALAGAVLCARARAVRFDALPAGATALRTAVITQSIVIRPPADAASAIPAP